MATYEIPDEIYMFQPTVYPFTAFRFHNGTQYFIRSIEKPVTSLNPIIQLPNGAAYDPYQNYDAPIILPVITINFSCFSKNETDPSQVNRRYWAAYYTMLGRHGILYAYDWYQRDASAYARCVGLSREYPDRQKHWNSPTPSGGGFEDTVLHISARFQLKQEFDDQPKS